MQRLAIWHGSQQESCSILIDERGFFHEAFRAEELEAALGKRVSFVQVNHSRSWRGVLRGLHAENWEKLVHVAHGYCVMSGVADYTYQVTAYYNGSDTRAVAWDDPDLGIHWPVAQPIVSDRDLNNPRLCDLWPTSTSQRVLSASGV
jgi:dTDP-4-dehydrorhamnose 3,5-epimerase